MMPDKTKQEIRDEQELWDDLNKDPDEEMPEDEEGYGRSAIGRLTTTAPAKTSLYRPPRCD